jgi:plastocyanin
MMSLRRTALCLALSLPLFSCGSDDPTQPTDDATVDMRADSFSPRTVRLTLNGTVTWRNNSGVAHTSTGNNNLWDSGSVADGAVFTRDFTATGTFGYRCIFHPNMTGTIIVE